MLIEYPHCKNCNEHYYCKKHGLSHYKPRFLKLENYAECLAECPYDKRCKIEAVFECSQYRQWCEEDLEVAKEMNYKEGCFRR